MQLAPIAGNWQLASSAGKYATGKPLPSAGKRKLASSMRKHGTGARRGKKGNLRQARENMQPENRRPSGEIHAKCAKCMQFQTLDIFFPLFYLERGFVPFCRNKRVYCQFADDVGLSFVPSKGKSRSCKLFHFNKTIGALDNRRVN